MDNETGFASITPGSIIPLSQPLVPSNSLNLTNQFATLSGTSQGVQNFGSPQIYADSGRQQFIVANTTPTVLMGNQATFGEGFYVSKPGINVVTNTDPTQLIFNSNQDTFKITETGTAFIPSPNGTAGIYSTEATLTVSGTPAFLAFVNVGVISFALPFVQLCNVSGTNDGKFAESFAASLFNENLTFTHTVSAAGITDGVFTNSVIPVKYYILQEST